MLGRRPPFSLHLPSPCFPRSLSLTVSIRPGNNLATPRTPFTVAHLMLLSFTAYFLTGPFEHRHRLRSSYSCNLKKVVGDSGFVQFPSSGGLDRCVLPLRLFVSTCFSVSSLFRLPRSGVINLSRRYRSPSDRCVTLQSAVISWTHVFVLCHIHSFAMAADAQSIPGYNKTRRA